MDKKRKTRFIKKYLLVFSLLLFLGIYSLVTFAYSKHLKQYGKDSLSSSKDGFVQTITFLNQASNLEREINNLEDIDPEILSLSQKQISCLNNAKTLSQRQIEVISGIKNIGSIGQCRSKLLSFYSNVNSVFSKDLEYKNYFNSLNQVIDILRIAENESMEHNPESGINFPNNNVTISPTEEIAILVQEKLIEIIPPKELRGFHQNLLGININNNKSGVEENSQQFKIKIEQVYLDLEKEINQINQEARELKKLLSSELVKYGVDPLNIDIETWK